MAPKKETQAHEFARGDLVQLRSGGPAMTVAHRFESYEGVHGVAYLCFWFDVDLDDRRQIFSGEVLMPAEPEK